MKKSVFEFVAENWDEVKPTKQLKRMLKYDLDWVTLIEEFVTTKIFSVKK